MGNSRNNPSSLLTNFCTPTKFFQMVELVPGTVGKPPETASVILSLNTAPRAVTSGLKFSKKSKNSEAYCKPSSEGTFYLIHPLTVCEVLKSPGSTVVKKDIPEGKCRNCRVFHAQEFEKMTASLLS